MNEGNAEGCGSRDRFLKDGTNYSIPVGMCINVEIAVLIYNMFSCVLNNVKIDISL